MSTIVQHNIEELKRLRRDVASDFLEVLKKTIIEMDLVSNVSKAINLLDSWEIVDSVDETIVGSLVEWAFNTEYGRLAGSPVPYDSILQWVMKKKDPTLSESEAKRVAYKVAEGIRVNGIKPTRFMKIAIEKFVRR